MDLTIGPSEPEPFRTATRDEVQAALGQHPDVAQTIGLLVSDLRSSLGWNQDDSRDFVVDTAAAILEVLEYDSPGFEQQVIENVQQRIHDEFIDTSWPECPAHGGHPLWPTEESPCEWTCGDIRIPLGRLSG